VWDHKADQREVGRIVVQQLLPVLKYAHNRVGVVHFDVRPANVVMDAEGNAMLVDWALSAYMKGGKVSVRGTPEFSVDGMFAGAMKDIQPQRKVDLAGLVYTWFALVHGGRAQEAPWMARLGTPAHESRKRWIDAHVADHEDIGAARAVVGDITGAKRILASSEFYDMDKWAFL
jgi:serine/threonine protein kinase